MPITPTVTPTATPEVEYDRQPVRELTEHEQRYFFSAEDVEARIEQKYSELEEEIQKQLED